MLYREWITKPIYRLANTEDNSLKIICYGQLITSDHNITTYEEELEIVDDQTGIPFRGIHDLLIRKFEDWIVLKQEEHD